MEYNELPLVKFVQQHRPEEWDDIISFLSLHVSYVSLLIVLLIAYKAVYRKKIFARRILFRLITALLLSGILNFLTKIFVARPRPFAVSPEIVKMSSGGSFSFPSGHTTEVFVLVFVLWHYAGRWLRALLLVWALFIAYSRVALGVHYPTDVAGGMALAFLAVRLTDYVLANWQADKTTFLFLFLFFANFHFLQNKAIIPLKIDPFF